MKKQAEFKAELVEILNAVYAKIVGEDDAAWLIHFELNGIAFQCYYDDGVSCYRMSKPFYNPLEWGEPYLSTLKTLLQSLRN
jgi:hypothetical protein